MTVSRRPGCVSGRRFALLAALIVVALTTATRASAQTVVRATVLGEGPGSAVAEPLSSQALLPCPSYSGSSPITLYPSQQPFSVPATSWNLSTVITCGMNVPLSDVNSVQVLNPAHGYEDPLSTADLVSTTQYDDPASPQALPVISTDGGQDLNWFTRPWRGGGDANGRDQVTEYQAPVSIVVFTKGTPLAVRPAQHALRKNGKGFTTQLSATATDAGSPVPAAVLRWSWNFADGTASHATSPTHTFADGVYAVTVLVTDTQTGRGGTATLLVSAPVHAPQGSATRSGGQRPSRSSSPTGSDRARSTKSGTSTRSGTTPSPAAKPGPTRTGPAPAPSTPTTTPSPAAPASPRVRASRPRPQRIARPARHRTASRGSGVTLVTGRLIADVMPLPAGAGALRAVRPTPASATPVVRQASTGPVSLSEPLAALAVLGLLALGAAHEGWGIGRRRAPRADG